MASIYGLIDENGDLRYIGKANNPRSRLDGHLRERRRRTPLYDWLGTLTASPQLLVLEEACDNWKVSEIEWIEAARQEVGNKLLNLANGGDEPLCSTAVRSANGHALVARLRRDPRLAKLRDLKRFLSTALNKGMVMNKTRDKMMQLAADDPIMFGKWRNIPYREENEDGSPVAGYA